MSSYIAVETELIDSGSTMKAQPPVVSGKAPLSETITGVPQAIASKGGIPNPSYKEGKTNRSANV